ncbi:proteasome inhibitor PI31 subunit [Halyomorpha halys]|uniref:proteasome inhibitor PI31 subunit n=1 Tax=Halyomorpha halys TaxID=286706 RepID=UPI0006D4CB80|nr:proteasome inhibitor PI31 subunit [Halyomorpha halys]
MTTVILNITKMSELFGWDLMYKVSEKDLKKKEDVITLFIHYLLIKAGYKCIGLGEDKALTGNEVATETLPTDWNSGLTYSLRYIYNNSLFIFKGIPLDDNIVYNLLHAAEMKVTNAAFNVQTTVEATSGPLATLIPSHEQVMKKIQQEFIAPMGNGNKKEATTQACAMGTGRTPADLRRPYVEPTNPLYVGPSGPGGPIPIRPDPFWADPERDPLRVGQSDLDPLGRGGGGMIFNPFNNQPGGGLFDPSAGLPGPPLPRGSVPPGARFDPFGPPTGMPRPRRPPGSDEFPPPGFGDMFM